MRNEKTIEAPIVFRGPLDAMPVSLARGLGHVGYVYAISLTSGRTKIGRSSNPYSRVRAQCVSFQGSGVDVSEVVISCRHAQSHATEAALHRYFASSRQDGEFFTVSIDEVCDALVFLSVKPILPEEEMAIRKERKQKGDALAVAILTSSKRENVKATEFLPEKKAAVWLYHTGRRLGHRPEIAYQAAIEAVRERTGVDVAQVLRAPRKIAT